MSDEHVRNAIAALSRWRAGLKRKGEKGETKRQVDDAIQRFRRILRQREKASEKPRRMGRLRRNT
jgi:predicted TPR repeat methyltransferase